MEVEEGADVDRRGRCLRGGVAGAGLCCTVHVSAERSRVPDAEGGLHPSAYMRRVLSQARHEPALNKDIDGHESRLYKQGVISRTRTLERRCPADSPSHLFGDTNSRYTRGSSTGHPRYAWMLEPASCITYTDAIRSKDVNWALVMAVSPRECQAAMVSGWPNAAVGPPESRPAYRSTETALQGEPGPLDCVVRRAPRCMPDRRRRPFILGAGVSASRWRLVGHGDWIAGAGATIFMQGFRTDPQLLFRAPPAGRAETEDGLAASGQCQRPTSVAPDHSIDRLIAKVLCT